MATPKRNTIRRARISAAQRAERDALLLEMLRSESGILATAGDCSILLRARIENDGALRVRAMAPSGTSLGCVTVADPKPAEPGLYQRVERVIRQQQRAFEVAP